MPRTEPKRADHSRPGIAVVLPLMWAPSVSACGKLRTAAPSMPRRRDRGRLEAEQVRGEAGLFKLARGSDSQEPCAATITADAMDHRRRDSCRRRRVIQARQTGPALVHLARPRREIGDVEADARSRSHSGRTRKSYVKSQFEQSHLSILKFFNPSYRSRC